MGTMGFPRSAEICPRGMPCQVLAKEMSELYCPRLNLEYVLPNERIEMLHGCLWRAACANWQVKASSR